MPNLLPPATRSKYILVLALPMILSMLSENLTSLVDTLMVGTLGTTAVAALGVGSFLYFVSFALLMGVCTGVQTLSSWRFGEKRFDELAQPLNAGILISLALSIPTCFLLHTFAPAFLGFITQDPEVLAIAIPFFKWRVIGILFLSITFSFQGYWNAINLGKRYFGMLVIAHSLNIILNVVFIFGFSGIPAYGAPGAGMASSLSLFIASLYCLYLGIKNHRHHGFLSALPSRKVFRNLVKVGFPIGLEKLGFMIILVFNMKIIGMISSEALAGNQVGVQLILLSILPAMGFGLAATTLVGQALGEGDPDKADQWAWDVAKLAGLFALVIGVTLFTLAPWVVKYFLSDPYTASITVAAVRIFCFVLWAETVGRVFMGALNGAGDTKRVTLFSLFHMLFLFIPGSYIFGLYLGYGLPGVWFGDALSQLIFFAGFVLLWKGGKWALVKNQTD